VSLASSFYICIDCEFNRRSETITGVVFFSLSFISILIYSN